MAENSIEILIRKVVCEQLGVSEEELDNLDPGDDRVSEVICEQLGVSEEELVVLDSCAALGYGIEISDEDVERLRTVRDIIEYIEAGAPIWVAFYRNLALYDDSDKFVVNPGIPEKKLAGAKRSYLQSFPAPSTSTASGHKEALLAIYDSTAFTESAADGVAFTTHGLYWRDPFNVWFKPVRAFPYSQLKSTPFWEGGILYLDSSTSLDFSMNAWMDDFADRRKCSTNHTEVACQPGRRSTSAAVVRTARTVCDVCQPVWRRRLAAPEVLPSMVENVYSRIWRRGKN